MDSEQYEELQNLLTKSREDEKNIKNELNTLQQTLADEKQKSEESLALVKQKEEDIKVKIFLKKLWNQPKFHHHPKFAPLGF